MPFAFSLAAVLRLRIMVEEREERLLQQIVLELNQTREHLESGNRTIVDLYASMGQGKAEPAAGHAWHAAYGDIKALTDARKDLEARIEKLEALRDRQRLMYQAAHRDREVLTEIHQEKRTAYDLETARREQKLLDDNHIARRNR